MAGTENPVVDTDTSSPGQAELDSLDAITDAGFEELEGLMSGDDGATDEETTEEVAETVTKDEPTEADDSDGNDEPADGEGEIEGEDDDVQGEPEADAGKPEDNFYSQEELDKLPPEHMDMDRVPPGAKAGLEKARQIIKAHQKKLQEDALAQKKNAQEANALRELRESIQEQTRLAQKRFDLEEGLRVRAEREERYRRIAETRGDEAAELERWKDEQSDKFSQTQAPRQENSEVASLKAKLEALEQRERQKQHEEYIRQTVEGAMDAAGLDKSDDNAFMDVHRELLAVWEMEHTNGARKPEDYTPAETIVKKMAERSLARVSRDAIAKSNPKLIEEIKRDAIAEFLEKNKKRKQTKTVVPEGAGEVSPKSDSGNGPDSIDSVDDVFDDAAFDEFLNVGSRSAKRRQP